MHPTLVDQPCFSARISLACQAQNRYFPGGLWLPLPQIRTILWRKTPQCDWPLFVRASAFSRPAAAQISSPIAATPTASRSSNAASIKRPWRQFQAATYADPGNADGYYNLGIPTIGWGPRRLPYREKRLSGPKPRKTIVSVSIRTPTTATAIAVLAVLLIEENRANEAFASIQTWAAQSPSLADPRMELARLYEEFGNKEAAANTLAEAVRLNPGRSAAVGRDGQGPRRDGRQQSGPHRLSTFAGHQPQPARRNRADRFAPGICLPISRWPCRPRPVRRRGDTCRRTVQHIFAGTRRPAAASQIAEHLRAAMSA